MEVDLFMLACEVCGTYFNAACNKPTFFPYLIGDCGYRNDLLFFIELCMAITDWSNLQTLFTTSYPTDRTTANTIITGGKVA